MKHKKAEAAAHQAAQQARVTIRQTIKALPVQIPSPRPSMEVLAARSINRSDRALLQDAIRPQEARKIAQVSDLLRHHTEGTFQANFRFP